MGILDCDDCHCKCFPGWSVGSDGSCSEKDAVGCLATKVKLVSTTIEPIQMFEIEVISTNQNVALSGTAQQSSSYNDKDDKFGADHSIDGDMVTFSHTKEGLSGEWWEVVWGQSVGVENVTIHNRYCRDETDPIGCLCRLTDVELQLYNETGSVVSSRSLGDTCGQLTVFEEFSSC